ncbi:MAG: hypothetical protein RL662_68 [Bacteroidota bacterium]|jgi:hypothetical protein
MKRELNDAIIGAIKSRLPQEKQIVSFLMDTLSLGRESVYRRIRGNVVFTFDEVVTVSTKLGFSVDDLVGLKESKRILFSADFHKNTSLEDIYYDKLVKYITYEENSNASSTVINRVAINYLPYSSSLYLSTLTKFRYYKWMHQTQGIETNFPMRDIVLPEKISDFQKKWFTAKNKGIIQSVFVIDKNIFLYMCNDINYFYSRSLLSNDELEQLKDELTNLIQYWEDTSRTGLIGGSPVEFYLLDFNLNTSYSQTDYDNNSISYIHTQNIISLRSSNKYVCEVQKKWIDLLKRYSVLITESGEMQRVQYFKKQREYIENMCIV